MEVGDEAHSDDSSPALSASSFTFSSLSSSSQGSTHGRLTAARSEVDDIISRLIRLSASIRRSGSYHHDLKAESFVDRDKDGNDLTSRFATLAMLTVNYKFPGANEVLRKRLAESISRRRNRFAYCRTHQQKLSQVGPGSRKLTFPTQEKQKRPRLPVGITADPVSSQPEMIRREEVLLSDTSASRPDPRGVNLRSQRTSSQPPTVTSGSPTQAAELNYPAAPRVGERDIFQCPYCFILCPAKEARGKYWRLVIVVFNLFLFQLY